MTTASQDFDRLMEPQPESHRDAAALLASIDNTAADHPLGQRVDPAATPPAAGSAESSDIDYTVPAVIPEDDALPRLSWHMRMVRKYRNELVDLGDIYEAEMDRIRDRFDNRARIIADKAQWHEAPIRSYHLAHPEQRTIELPHGTSKVRVAKSPQVFMAGGEATATVTAWARTAHPEIMRGPNVSDVRRVVEIVTHDDGTLSVIDPKTGEKVPGVTAEWPSPSWSLDTEPGEPF